MHFLQWLGKCKKTFFESKKETLNLLKESDFYIIRGTL